MPALQRRRLLRGLGTLAAAGTSLFAGCLDETPADGDDADGDAGGHEYVGDGDVVDYPGMVDGAATVDPEERTITYDDPETAFELSAGYRGDPADDSELRVSRDLSGEAMAGFLAPVYDDGEFRFHVFANGAFVEFADWNAVVVRPDRELEGLDGATFEHLRGDVYGFAVAPGEFDSLAVVDATADEVRSGGEETSGIALLRGSTGTERAAPSVAFGFEYDADAERLEIRHEGGDEVAAERLRFDADGDPTVLEDFEGSVRAGDAAALSVPPTATVSVVWEAEDGDRSAVLARWTGPDA